MLVTVAFRDPRTIAWQAALIRHNLSDVIHVIADNTPEDDLAAEIGRCAATAGALYVHLPRNPSRAPSRSHGMAINWIWDNIIKPGDPEVFGFLDDDIYPTAPDDPFRSLSKQSFYGVVRPGVSVPFGGPAQRWFLWAGFCMFNFRAVRHIDLDFSQDWFVGLDTGGGNWNKLYRDVPRFSVDEQPTIFVPYREGLSMADAPIQWCGPWLHAVGLMGRPEHETEKAKAIARLLQGPLSAAGYSADLSD